MSAALIRYQADGRSETGAGHHAPDTGRSSRKGEHMSGNAVSKAITFEQTVTPSDELLLGIFTTALEGGIGYWSECSVYKHEGLPPSEAYAVIHETEHDEPLPHRITIETVREGLRNILTNQVKYNVGEGPDVARLAIGILNDEDYGYDAGDADNIVQAGLFKELVYG